MFACIFFVVKSQHGARNLYALPLVTEEMAKRVDISAGLFLIMYNR